MVSKQFGLTAVFIWLSPALVVLNIICILLIPESLTAAAQGKNHNHLSQSTVVQVIRPRGSDLRSSERLSTKDTKSHASFREAFIKGLMPEQLPNQLAGKYSVLMLMITCFIAMMAIIGRQTRIFRRHWL